MEQNQKPVISIGMIFRDDIRSIGRCLKALQPLRDAVPCELVMADTGSVDGSRAVAEQYADVLIDFEWINDFSAARNAVVDECSGKWHLTIDTDEYLQPDSDFKQLTDFLESADIQKYNAATVVIRNYDTYEMDGNYTDFMGIRLLRMLPGVRYQGALHEQWILPPNQNHTATLPGIVFNHDGYVELGANTEKGIQKRARNIKLMREKIKKDPKSLLMRLQFIESGGTEPDFLDQIYHAVRMVKRKVLGWEAFGPPILRYAVSVADVRGLSELEEWAELAKKLFPESMYTRLDIEYNLFARSWNAGDYADCVERGERYLLAMEDFRAGKDPTARVYSVLRMASPFQEQGVKIVLASAYAYEGKPEQALALLTGLDYSMMNGKQTMDILKSAQEIHLRSEVDTAPLIQAIWEGILIPKASQKQADQRKKVFYWMSGQSFFAGNREREEQIEGFCRYGYTLYLPLAGRCEIGDAARLMEMKDPTALEAALREVEDLNNLPIEALSHALDCGVPFPLEGKPLEIEKMEGLTKRMAADNAAFYSLVLRQAETDLSDWQLLTWVRGLVIAAVRIFRWEQPAEGMEEDAWEAHQEQGLALARMFARIERAFVLRYYTADARENIQVIPPMHRFGWHCALAFQALEEEEMTGFIRHLQEGLALYPDIAKMVEFLLNWAEEQSKHAQIAAAPPELILLAEQIRQMLLRFAPDDPAVEALKQSAAYQKVAWLIEQPAQPAYMHMKQ